MALDAGVSSSVKSKDISSIHYYGPSIRASLPGEKSDLPATSSLIPEGAPFNNANTQLFPTSYNFANPSSAQTWDKLMEYGITPYIISDRDGKLGYVMSTVYNRWFVPIVDLEAGGVTFNPVEDLYNPDDRKQDRFGRWKETTEQANAIEYVKSPEFQGFMVSSHERQAKHEPYKFVTDMEMYGPINRVGEMLSRAETLRQDALKHFNSKEGLRLMLENLKDSEGIEYLGVTPVDGILYAIGRRVRDGKLVLFTGINTYDKLAIEGDSFNLDLEDMIIAKLGEEAMHHYRKSYDRDLSTLENRLGEERATKQGLLAFYTRLMNESGSNPKLREKYAKIVRSIEHDIATIGRYRTLHGANNESTNNETDEEVVEYAERKLKEQVDAKRSRNSPHSSLEKNVKDAENSDLKESDDNLESEAVDYEADSKNAENGKEPSEAEKREAETSEAAAESE